MGTLTTSGGGLPTKPLTACPSIGRCAVERSFYQEPEERVHRVIRWVISERNLPGHDFEQMIEGWARKHGAGVYGEDHRHGSLKVWHGEHAAPRINV